MNKSNKEKDIEERHNLWQNWQLAGFAATLIVMTGICVYIFYTCKLCGC